jgi:hypothetical protein
MFRFRFLAGCAAAVLGGLLFRTETAFADLPSPRFDRLTPVGAAAGQIVEVQVLGADIEEVKSLLFDHPGLSAEFVEDRKFKIIVKDDVPAGTYDVRLVGRFGVSNPRLFAVSRGLSDVAETEPNNEPVEAQEVAVNSGINGVSDGNGEDFFLITLQAGQRVVFDCLARRLESQMDANLELSSESGRILASNGDYFGADPFLDFVAPSDGRYVLRVNDLRFRGGFPYRLLISDRPHIETIHPRAIQAGTTAQIEVAGRNLGAGAQPVAFPSDGPPLEKIMLDTAAIVEPVESGRYLFIDHPTGHSVLPTAATCTLNGFQLRPIDNALNAIPILVSESPVTLEVEPNDSPEQTQKITIPAVVACRLEKPRDGDWFEFQVPENGQYGFEVYSERIDGGSDPFLVVMDDKGNRVSELDDYGHRINAFDGHLRDPSGRVNLSKDRQYRALVQDRYGRGGARYQYVLVIRPEQPDWFAAAIHSQNPGPGGATVWKGSSMYLDVVIHQRDGFNGPISITAEGLPDGVTAAPTVLHNATHGTFVITASESAADWTGEVMLVATSEVNGRKLRREVRPHSKSWNDGGMNSSRPTRKLGLAVRETGPFGLSIEPARVTVEAGKPVELMVKATRHWKDFSAAINLLPLALPGGFSMSSASIGAGGTEAKITITVQNGRLPGDYTMTVLGQAQVPFSKDREATSRPNTLVSLPSIPVTITVPEPEAKP